MALIKCPQCGKEISDKAKKCVGCGWEVNLGVLNVKEKEIISGNAPSKINVSDIEDEQKKTLKDAELEIEKVKESARQKVKSINESAKAMVAQKQKELELEYKEREKELAKQRESLEMSQQELERAKREQTTELQRDVSVEKKMNLPNTNILLFMVTTILIMLCFMFIVWRKLNSFSSEIAYLASRNQTESEMPVDGTENIPDGESDVITEENLQEDYDDESTSASIGEIDNAEENITEQEMETGSEEIITNKENDSRIQISYDSCKISRYTELVFTIKNVSDENMIVSVNSYQYINDVAVKNFGTIEYNSDIPAGKATVVNYTFDREDVSFADINKIEFVCKSSNGTDAEIENSIIFDNLNINIK